MEKIILQKTYYAQRCIVRHNNLELVPIVSVYENEQIKLSLVDAETGEVAIVASMQTKDKLDKDEVIIKTFGELQDGILESLIIYGVVSNPERYLIVGLKKHRVPICKLIKTKI